MEVRRRRMEPFDRFIVPAGWGRGYAKLAKSVPHCADFRSVDLARGLVARFIDPVLAEQPNIKTWSHEKRFWI